MTKITPLVSIVAAYRETNDYFLNVINKLSDSQIRWRPNSSCHSIAFILWHVARWTDFLQATIPGMTEELDVDCQQGDKYGIKSIWPRAGEWR